MFTSRLYTSRWGNPQWDKTTLTWLGSDANGEGAWLVLPLASALGETLQFYSNTSPQPLILLACSLISIKGLGLAHEHMSKAQCVIINDHTFHLYMHYIPSLFHTHIHTTEENFFSQSISAFHSCPPSGTRIIRHSSQLVPSLAKFSSSPSPRSMPHITLMNSFRNSGSSLSLLFRLGFSG